MHCPSFRALVLGDVVIGGDAIEGDARRGSAHLPARLVRHDGGRARVVRRHRPARARCGASRQEPAERILTTHGRRS